MKNCFTSFIAIALFITAAPSESSETCSNLQVIDPAINSLPQCTSMIGPSARSKCLSALFVSYKPKVAVRDDGSFAITLFKPFCIKSTPVNARSSGTRIFFSPSGQLSSITSFLGTIQIGNIFFSEDICGWAIDRSKAPKLSNDFNFIPADANVKVSSTGCHPDGKLNPGIVMLISKSNVCSTELSAKTSFGYAADDQMHFTALNDGTMKGTDKRGKPIDIPIKKGKDYRNADPAEHPCAWEETPEEVLKSFTEEHSE